MQAVFAEAANQRTKEKAQQLLKSYSLRSIKVRASRLLLLYIIPTLSQNIFWKLGNTDPYRAISFDILHAHHAGLWGDHLWPEVQRLVAETPGRSETRSVDEL
jgi:hypothetical protein